ncbi:M20 family metallopeptidase [Parendozoicomonas haliclonae]|uniref:Carboxypeptidase G2 n=1 Tax=Parendozoicomonas haliclonae TaxID=1960125 RepID=A0A1X7AN87_9GAMM|nr:M20 family metallopeptidase [Parendozoicomonas haliclonae]SMA49764.1 Carboxypeptidase G2 precursor [Parendozoicomonas haliclonae]
MSFSVEAYLDELRPLIDVDCGTYTLEGIEAVADIMTAKYEAMGWNVKRVALGKAGSGLEVRNKPEAEHIDVMLIGHMDTVFPVGTVAERPMTFDETNAYGPGVSDMKAGLLNVVYALRSLDAAVLDKLSIAVCMNPDEETGSNDSAAWLKSVAQHAKTVLVAEPARANGALVKARKGIAGYDIEFSGKAAHAGNEPEKGRSAIHEMAQWIASISAMTNFETGTTFNFGVVSGGTAGNVVAEKAKADLDIRFWSNEDYAAVEAKLAEMAEKPFINGVEITLKRTAYKPAMTPSSATEELMKLVEECGKDVDVDIEWMAVGGGSDGNTTALVCDAVLDGFGPIGGGLHTADEYLVLDSIEPRIKLLQRVIAKLAE